MKSRESTGLAPSAGLDVTDARVTSINGVAVPQQRPELPDQAPKAAPAVAPTLAPAPGPAVAAASSSSGDMNTKTFAVVGERM